MESWTHSCTQFLDLTRHYNAPPVGRRISLHVSASELPKMDIAECTTRRFRSIAMLGTRRSHLQARQVANLRSQEDVSAGSDPHPHYPDALRTPLYMAPSLTMSGRFAEVYASTMGRARARWIGHLAELKGSHFSPPLSFNLPSHSLRWLFSRRSHLFRPSLPL